MPLGLIKSSVETSTSSRVYSSSYPSSSGSPELGSTSLLVKRKMHANLAATCFAGSGIANATNVDPEALRGMRGNVTVSSSSNKPSSPSMSSIPTDTSSSTCSSMVFVHLN